MGVNLIKDSKGNSHMVFRHNISKNKSHMGNSINDFEILQILGEGSYGCVAKVKSKLNKKIYAMKQLSLNILAQKNIIDLIENEIQIMEKLHHHSIIKYYKSFKSDGNIYIVMEYMDNGDLAKLIKSHIILNKPIEEDRLWNIFIQSLRSLEFIHSKEIIHRDIKPENLFISNNGVIKLGDFGFSANYKNNSNFNNFNMNMQNQNMQNQIMRNNSQKNLAKIDCSGTVIGTENFMSPEMINNGQYDLKTDVYSMGCTFFQAMFWTTPNIKNMCGNQMFPGNNMNNFFDNQIINNKNFYSRELVNLVYKMIDINKNQRPDSKTILNLFIKEFINKYSKNSGISSVLSCLYSCTDLVNYFKNQDMNFSYYLNNKNISLSFFSGLNSINDLKNWKSFLCKFRLVISKQNSQYEKDMEINPRSFLSYLLKILHQELNNKNGNFINPFSTLFTGRQDNNTNNNNNNNQQNIMVSSNSMNFSSKEKSFEFFKKYFNENNNSIISNSFYGNMKSKTLCESCQLKTYTFNFFNFITFNLDLIQKYARNHNIQNQISIADCFTMQNDILIKVSDRSKICRNCKKKKHYERKQYYTFPKYLIVCFER